MIQADRLPVVRVGEEAVLSQKPLQRHVRGPIRRTAGEGEAFIVGGDEHELGLGLEFDVFDDLARADAPHTLPRRDHLVTQCMSAKIFERGRFWNSSQVNVTGASTKPARETRHPESYFT